MEVELHLLYFLRTLENTSSPLISSTSP
jgi:hypothetical protein